MAKDKRRSFLKEDWCDLLDRMLVMREKKGIPEDASLFALKSPSE